MSDVVLVDTGPLIALINDRDQWHTWTTETLRSLAPPLVTCEAVLTETCHLAATRTRGGAHRALSLFRRGAATLGFSAQDELGALDELMRRYADAPMSLADACLVRMSELYPQSLVLTLDSDFRLYRRNRRQRIPLLIPDV